MNATTIILLMNMNLMMKRMDDADDADADDDNNDNNENNERINTKTRKKDQKHGAKYR